MNFQIYLQIPSFFDTLESPAVAEYKRQQELALAAAVRSGRKIVSRLDSEIVGDDERDDFFNTSEDVPAEVKSGSTSEGRKKRVSTLAGIDLKPEEE